MLKSPLLLSHDRYGGLMFGQLGSGLPIFHQLGNNCESVELLFSEALVASVVTNVPFVSVKNTLKDKISIIAYLHGEESVDAVKNVVRQEVCGFYKTVGVWLHRLLLFAMRNFAYEENLMDYTVKQLLGLPITVTTDVPEECFDVTTELDVSGVNISEYNVVDLLDTRHKDEFVLAFKDGSLVNTAIGRLLAYECCLSSVNLGKRVSRFCCE